MFKLSALIGGVTLFFSSWLTGYNLPRLTQGPGDYLLMPLFGYLMIIIAAQVAARIIPEQS